MTDLGRARDVILGAAYGLGASNRELVRALQDALDLVKHETAANGRSFTVMMPWPISVNGAYRNSKEGVEGRPGRFKTKAHVNWISEADRWLLHQKTDGLRLPSLPIEGPVSLTICGNPQGPTVRDLSNIVKLPEDRLKLWQVYRDDSQVEDLRIYKDPFRDDPERRTVSPGAIMVTAEEM